MNIFNLRETESATIRDTKKNLNGWFIFREELINTYFLLNHFFELNQNRNTDIFYYHCRQVYFNLPYSLEALNIIFDRGYYLESSALLRNFYENLIKLLYLKNNPESVSKHLIPENSKDRQQFKTMFDFCSKGLYEYIYKNQLSEFAHGGIGASTFRTKLIPPNFTEWILGNYWNEVHATYIVNQLVPILYAFTLHIPYIFPDYDENNNLKIEQDRNKHLDWLEKCYQSQKSSFPEYQKYSDLMDQIIYKKY